MSLVGVETRLESLTGDGETLHGFEKMDETNAGAYYLTARTWPHPDVKGATTLSLRYAYLTKGDGNDGWTEEGMNIRLPAGEQVEDAIEGVAAVAASPLGEMDA